MRVLTRDQVRQVDRVAIERYGMSGLVLMENAGRGCADVLTSLGIAGPVVICCGKGNNAGDGFVLARHLALRGYEPKVLLWDDPHHLRDDARENYRLLAQTDIPIRQIPPGELSVELTGCDWIVDALLGTGAQGPPRPPLNEVIDVLNRYSARKLAIDLPSGLDCDTGEPADPTFQADHTCTFVAWKTGFLQPVAVPFLGHVHVLDIGVPPRWIDEVLEDKP